MTIQDTPRSAEDYDQQDFDDFPRASDFEDPTSLSSNFRRKKTMQWHEDDYAPHITGHAARKLADSGVAPLVAFARNYQVVTEENARELFELGGINRRTKAFDLLKEACTGMHPEGEMRDGLVMPWFAVKDVSSCHVEGDDIEDLQPRTVQYRPSDPYTDRRDKVVKYVFVKGKDMLLDVHPSTPAQWLNEAPIIMFCEGLLKGDSAFSAWLAYMGMSREDLAGRFDNPRSELADFMDEIPLRDQMVILRSPSVTTFHKDRRSWLELPMAGREGWVAFDADISLNGMVWNEANRLRSVLLDKERMTKVRYLSPVVQDDQKAGIDDFLSHHGDWADLLEFLADELPARPVQEDDRPVGSWRITRDGFATQVLCPMNDGQSGQFLGNEWRHGEFKMGGRILSMENSRQPTDEEIRSGLLNPDPGHGDRSVEIEIAWKDDGAEFYATVRGPETLLTSAPEGWESKGGHVPARLARHWQWPPRGKDGERFLEAIKSHRTQDIDDRTRWMRMGWVPTPGHLPSFIVGDDIISESEEARDSVIPGVTSELLHSYDSFGVGGAPEKMLDIDFESPAYQAQVRADLEAVMELYVNSGAWTNRGDASIVLATALRPVVPVRPKASVFIQGPKGKGKSMSAQHMMLFWAANCGDWQDNLPGSADDTEASTENSVAHAPIWVVDDLAPSTSGRQAQLAESRIENLVRSIFNRSSRGRMTANMTTRRSNPPIAQLVVTAENELNTPSARERLVPLYIGAGALHADRKVTNAIAARAMEDGLQARFTRHLIGWALHEAAEKGWEAFYTKIEQKLLDNKAWCGEEMKALGAKDSEVERASVLASDLAISSYLLKGMADHVKSEEYLRYFGEGMQRDILQNVHRAHSENRELSPGRSLMRALSNLLSSGRAHIGGSEDVSKPPYSSSVDEGGSDQQVNARLGWVPGGPDGQLKPSGIKIGTLVTLKDTQVVLFDETNAFQEAQRHYPDMILPGQKKSAGWSGIWEENLAADKAKRLKVNTIQKRIGLVSHRGVPVDLTTILNGGVVEVDPDED